MYRIALFLAEIADGRAEALIRGAVAKAKEKKAALTVYPGKYFVSAGNKENRLPDSFQETAVFDYATKENTDLVIIDLAEIAKYASSVKKEEIIKRYSFVPQIILDSDSGTDDDIADSGAIPSKIIYINEGDDVQSKGEAAVEEACRLLDIYNAIDGTDVEYGCSDHITELKKFFIDKRKRIQKKAVSGKFAAKRQDDIDRLRADIRDQGAFKLLEGTAHRLFHHNYEGNVNPYNIILDQSVSFGSSFGALYLFSEAVEYTKENIWKKPENIMLLSLMQDSEAIELEEAVEVPFSQAVRAALPVEDVDRHSPSICILNNLFLNDRQIGLMVTELSDEFCKKHINALFVSMVTGTLRLISNDRQLELIQNRLTESKRRVEKDTSVLERLGDEDYLTKCLNRRGFFSRAYDMLEKNFVEGTYAVVAYIDIDSIKSINANFGREEGDGAVIKVADILESVFGNDCVLGRIRGNEFAAILVTYDEELGERLKDEMSQQNLKLMRDVSKPYMIHLQCSICSFEHKKGLSLKKMLSETDDNLQKIRQI